MTDTGYWLTTERLGLRRFTDEDFDWFASLYADPDVTRHLGGVRADPMRARCSMRGSYVITRSIPASACG